MASWAQTDIRDCLTRAFQRISERTGYTMEQLEEFVGSIETLMELPKRSRIHVVKTDSSEAPQQDVFESVTVVVKKPGRKKTAFYSPTIDASKPPPQSVEDLFPTRIQEPAIETTSNIVKEEFTETISDVLNAETETITEITKEEITETVSEIVKEETTQSAVVPVTIKRKRPRIRVNREEEEQTTQTVAGFEITHLEKRKSSNIRDADFQKLVEHHFQLIGAGEEVEVHRRRIAGTEYYVTDKGGYVYAIGSDGSVNMDRLVGKIDDLDDEHIIMY